MTPIFRCATPNDPAWLAMRQALWPDTAVEEHRAEMAAWCADPDQCIAFVAEDESQMPLGFAEAALRHEYVNGTTTSPVGYLEGIYVLPKARRQGVARTLVEALERWSLEQGCTEFASDVNLDNTVSQSAHEALGFTETERVVFYRKPL